MRAAGLLSTRCEGSGGGLSFLEAGGTHGKRGTGTVTTPGNRGNVNLVPVWGGCPEGSQSGVGQLRPRVSSVRPLGNDGGNFGGMVDIMPNEVGDGGNSDEEVIDVKPEGIEGERLGLEDEGEYIRKLPDPNCPPLMRSRGISSRGMSHTGIGAPCALKPRGKMRGT